MIDMDYDDNFKIKVYDLGGHARIRDIWTNYYAEVVNFLASVLAGSCQWFHTFKDMIKNIVKGFLVQVEICF